MVLNIEIFQKHGRKRVRRRVNGFNRLLKRNRRACKSKRRPSAQPMCSARLKAAALKSRIGRRSGQQNGPLKSPRNTLLKKRPCARRRCVKQQSVRQPSGMQHSIKPYVRQNASSKLYVSSRSSMSRSSMNGMLSAYNKLMRRGLPQSSSQVNNPKKNLPRSGL
jgi:hypothetical protein